MLERERIFEDFYTLRNHDTQNKYLYGLIQKKAIKRQTRNARNYSLTYHIHLCDGSQVQVCKKTFCDLHAVSKRRVERRVENLLAGVLAASDQRGKHRNQPHAIPVEAKKQVREHIESFPRRKSQYSHSDNRKREYLNEGLSISRMYCLHLDKYEPQTDATKAKVRKRNGN